MNRKQRKIESNLVPDLSIEDLMPDQSERYYQYDPTAVEREIRRIQLDRAVIEEAETVQKGDFVEILPDRLADPLQLTAGLGLYDPELEAALIGLQKGMHAGPEGRGCTVLGIRRRNIPAFSDELARELGAASAAEYRQSRRNELRNAVIRDRARELTLSQMTRLCEETELAEHGGEVEALTDSYLETSLEMLRSRNLDPSQMAPDDLEQSVGFRSIEEARPTCRDNAIRNLKMAVIGQKAADAVEKHFSEEEYQAFVQHQTEKYLMDPALAEKLISPLDFLVSKNVGILVRELRKRIAESLEEA